MAVPYSTHSSLSGLYVLHWQIHCVMQSGFDRTTTHPVAEVTPELPFWTGTLGVVDVVDATRVGLPAEKVNVF